MLPYHTVIRFNIVNLSKQLQTNRLIETLKPGAKPYFIRDTKCKGFGVKVNPSGSVKYYAETKHQGKTNRKTLGEYPLLSLDQESSGKDPLQA